MKLDAETQQRLFAMISVGCSVRCAATLCGCNESAVRKRERTDPDFQQRLRNALQIREIGPLQQIREAGHKSWQAAAWLLERMNPKEYSEKPAAPANPFSLKHAIEWVAEADEERRQRREEAADERECDDASDFEFAPTGATSAAPQDAT
ncbi:MAG: hypothetical protein QM775_10475 [Pirellulales bacterium]